MKELEELVDSAAVAAWSPEDTYANLIMEAAACYGQLAGVITVKEFDLNAGEGDIIQVRYAPARDAQGPFTFSGTACLSDVTSTLGTYPIQLARYGDYDYQRSYNVWEAGGEKVRGAILKEMGKGLAVAQDARIWNRITRSMGTCCETGALCSEVTYSGGTCICGWSFANGLYNCIVSVQKYLEGQGYKPDYVIMPPGVAKWLYFRGATESPSFNTRYGVDGTLQYIGPLKVIESCCTEVCNEDSGTTVAVVLDHTRAVGEVYGKRPTYERERDAACDAWKEVVWMYWNAHEMEYQAIGHIRSGGNAFGSGC